MNKQIKLLAEQAYFETEYDDTQNLPELMVRFAELIVKECATVADHWVMFDEGPLQYGPVGEKIKEHFGVEE